MTKSDDNWGSDADPLNSQQGEGRSGLRSGKETHNADAPGQAPDRQGATSLIDTLAHRVNFAAEIDCGRAFLLDSLRGLDD